MSGNKDLQNAQIIAISSGKGGVGKTNICTNLGILIAQSGKRVCIVDADHGLANINILLGIAPFNPDFNIYEQPENVALAIHHTSYNLDILPAFSGVSRETEIASPDFDQISAIFERLKTLYDVILIDTAAGINKTVKNYLKIADYVILTLIPEPTSLTDGFGLVRAMKDANQQYQVIINRVSGLKQDNKIFDRFSKAVKKFIGFNIEHLGYIEDDPYVPFAILRQKPIVFYRSDSPATHCLDRIGQRIIRDIQVRRSQQKTHRIQQLPKNPKFNQVSEPTRTPFDVWLEKLPEFFSGFSDNRDERIARFNQFRDKLQAVIEQDADFEKRFIQLAQSFRQHQTDSNKVADISKSENHHNHPQNWLDDLNQTVSVSTLQKDLESDAYNQPYQKNNETLELKEDSEPQLENSIKIESESLKQQSPVPMSSDSETEQQQQSVNKLLSDMFSLNYGDNYQELKDTINFLKKLP